jgi:fructose-specific phosphotransferase system IIC component
MRYTVKQTFGQNALGALAAYAILDVLFAGLGMGTAAFCIVLGLPVGWFAARRAEFYVPELRGALTRSLRYALMTSGITVLIMLAIWGRLIPYLFERVTDPGNMGLPLDLYSTKASLYGWLVLMVGVGPAFQFLVTVFGSYLTFAKRLKRIESPAGFPPEP